MTSYNTITYYLRPNEDLSVKENVIETVSGPWFNFANLNGERQTTKKIDENTVESTVVRRLGEEHDYIDLLYRLFKSHLYIHVDKIVVQYEFNDGKTYNKITMSQTEDVFKFHMENPPPCYCGVETMSDQTCAVCKFYVGDKFCEHSCHFQDDDEPYFVCDDCCNHYGDECPCDDCEACKKDDCEACKKLI